MTAEEFLEALDLPAAVRVGRRVPKTLLTEHGVFTSADKKRIADGIDQLQWIAALKPTTIGVAEYRDGIREYVEIAILHLLMRPAAQRTRLVELVHRAIPYPVLLIAEQEDVVELSAAHKRWSQGEAGKTVLDGEIVRIVVRQGKDGIFEVELRDALAIGRKQWPSLYGVYQGLIDSLLAFRAAQRTGHFNLSGSPEMALVRREALQDCERLEVSIAGLRAAAEREKQVSRLVELNLELKQLEAELAAAQDKL